jgi:ketosteroid isomerase-like protein
MATDSQIENVARVRAGLEAFNRGDFDAVLAILEAGVEIFSSPALANPGTFRGHEGYERWVGEWLDAWEWFEVHPERIEPVGERHVVVDVHQTAHGRGSGIPVEMRIAYMFELGEQAMKALHLYPTWGEALAVAERREREAAE